MDDIYAIYDNDEEQILDYYTRSVEQGVKYIIAKDTKTWNQFDKDNPYFLRYEQVRLLDTPILDIRVHHKQNGFITRYKFTFIKLEPLQSK